MVLNGLLEAAAWTLEPPLNVRLKFLFASEVKKLSITSLSSEPSKVIVISFQFVR